MVPKFRDIVVHDSYISYGYTVRRQPRTQAQITKNK